MAEKLISISTPWLQQRFGDIRALEIAADAGFDGVDFSTAHYGLDPYWNHWNKRPSDFDDVFAYDPDGFGEYFTRIRERAGSLGLSIFQTHGRVSGYGADESANRQLRQEGEKDIRAAALLRSPYCVIHSVTTILMGRDADPERMHALNYRMYTDLTDVIRETGVKVALETFGNAVCGGENGIDFFAIPEEFLKSYHSLDKNGFVLCLDSGHSNVASAFGYPKVDELVHLYGSDIKLLHLHDNHHTRDEHGLPFTGDIDWSALMKALEEIHYDGAYNFEVNIEKFGPELSIETTAFLAKVARQLTAQSL